jgi:hypothetical protein
MPAITVPPQIIAAQKKRQADAKAAAKKAAQQGTFTQNADDIINSIINKSSVTDPTAIATGVATGSNNTLPTTAGNIPAPNVNALSGQDFTNNFIQYFSGVGGKPSLIQFTNDPKTKVPFVGMVNAAGSLDYVAIAGDPKDPTRFKVTDLTTAYNDYIKNYNLSDPNSVSALKKKLYESGVLKSAEAKQSLANNKFDSILGKAIVKDIITTTNSNYITAQKGIVDQFVPLGGATGGSRTSTSLRTQLQTLANATTSINSTFQKYLGRNATSQEVQQYYRQYNDFARKNAARVTTTTDFLNTEKASTTVGGVTAEDAQAIQIGMISDELRAAGKNPDAISKLGGDIGRYMSMLKQSASEYGVNYDSTRALNDAIGAIQPGSSITAQQDKFKALAKIQYKSLAGAIQEGLTVKDVVDNYTALHKKYMETEVPLDPMGSDAQKALTGGANNGTMTQDEYVRYLKGKPEWAKTQNAREEAANYATTILKQFGLMA